MDTLEDELDRMCLIPVRRLLESKSSGVGSFSHDVSHQASPSKTEETNNNDDLSSLSSHEGGKFKEADEAEDESPVPAWMIPDDLTLSSDDEEEENQDQDTVRSCSLDRYLQDDGAGVDNTEGDKLDDESFLDKLNNGDMKNDEPAERQEVEESQTIVRNFVLNQKQGVDTELMMAERLYQVDADYLATVVCAMLNSKQGGTIFIGVKTNGVIRGIKLDRHKRDKMRQLLDRVCNHHIFPRTRPADTDIEFMVVEDQQSYITDLQLVIIEVKGGEEVRFRARGMSHYQDGCYVRQGRGPDFNVLVDT